jgi:NitT/TauT family transport system ATP-binding protein
VSALKEDISPITELESAKTLLSLREIGKQFDNGTVALSGVNLKIERGTFTSLLGASGCGKSTLLRLIAGLAQPSGGKIDWLPGARLNIGCVFQEATLMPWATALKNVMLPLKLHGISRDESESRAREALAAVGLGDFAEAYPRELSGGMKMRVSLARALVTKPDLLLLDEPFAALDEITRFKINNDLAALWRERGFTAIFVTHSVFESVYLSQRIVVMAARPGRVFAEVPVDAPAQRTEDFRTSSAYADYCRIASAKLKKAMSS